jgi:hypothetical protein
MDETHHPYKALVRRVLRAGLMGSASVSSMALSPASRGRGGPAVPTHPGGQAARAFAPGPRDPIRCAGRRGSP